MNKQTENKKFTLFAECIFPEDLFASRIPDDYLGSCRLRLYDKEQRETIVDYQDLAIGYLKFLGIDAPLQSVTIIDVWDDKYYTQDEREKILFPELEKIITELTDAVIVQNKGRYNHHRFFTLPNRWSQHAIAEFIKRSEKSPLFQTISTSLIYKGIPSTIIKNTGLPEEKIRTHDEDDGPPEYRALMRE